MAEKTPEGLSKMERILMGYQGAVKDALGIAKLQGRPQGFNNGSFQSRCVTSRRLDGQQLDVSRVGGSGAGVGVGVDTGLGGLMGR